MEIKNIIFSSFKSNKPVPHYILSGISDFLYSIIYLSDADTNKEGFIIIENF